MNKMRNLIANVILVILSVALVVNIFIAIGVVLDMNKVYLMDEDDFWWYISCEQYAEMVPAAWENRARGLDTKDTTLEQCYAVADYFEAASLYKVALERGKSEDATKYKCIMDEKRKSMDDILYVAENINEKLGIE